MNWLIELKRYKSSDLKDSSENFLTTSLIGIINADNDLKKKFINKIFKGVVYNVIEIKTQQTLTNRKIPDILVQIKDEKGDLCFIGIIECKLDAEPDDVQIREYAEQLKKDYLNIESQVSFLGRFPKPDLKSVTGEILTWWDVYYLFKEESDNPILNYYRKEFINLMNFEGITPPQKIETKWIKELELFYQNINNFENVFEKVIQNLVNTNKGMERTGKKQTTINTNYGYFSRSVFYKERNIYIYFGWNYDEQIPLYIGYNLENDHKFRIFKIMEKDEFWNYDIKMQNDYLFNELTTLLKNEKLI
ncbi:MAG: hypothetical protein WAT71_00450 [Ignavibacteria bacterium]